MERWRTVSVHGADQSWPHGHLLIVMLRSKQVGSPEWMCKNTRLLNAFRKKWSYDIMINSLSFILTV